MGLFSLRQELAIDLGTANTLIMHNRRLVNNDLAIVHDERIGRTEVNSKLLPE